LGRPQAAEKRATGLEAQLAALQTAQGVAELAQRAAQAEAWCHRADAAAEQLERLRGAYQHGRVALLWLVLLSLHSGAVVLLRVYGSAHVRPSQHRILLCVLVFAAECAAEVLLFCSAVRQQHAELRRQLEAGALATPSSAAGSPGACSDAAARTPPPQVRVGMIQYCRMVQLRVVFNTRRGGVDSSHFPQDAAC
jgi:hypothetical protein